MARLSRAICLTLNRDLSRRLAAAIVATGSLSVLVAVLGSIG